MISVISIGTRVTIDNEFSGRAISINIRESQVLYEVAKTTEDGQVIVWANDWEITSEHTSNTIINSCIK